VSATASSIYSQLPSNHNLTMHHAMVRGTHITWQISKEQCPEGTEENYEN